jgi:hypothetical protein
MLGSGRDREPDARIDSNTFSVRREPYILYNAERKLVHEHPAFAWFWFFWFSGPELMQKPIFRPAAKLAGQLK